MPYPGGNGRAGGGPTLGTDTNGFAAPTPAATGGAVGIGTGCATASTGTGVRHFQHRASVLYSISPQFGHGLFAKAPDGSTVLPGGVTGVPAADAAGVPAPGCEGSCSDMPSLHRHPEVPRRPSRPRSRGEPTGFAWPAADDR